jgi:carbon-monoxide dehydrogenase medium subunit
MMPFALAEPETLAEAVQLMREQGPDARPVAGGTAIMLMMKTGLFQPERLISLRHVEADHASVRMGPDGGLTIGAMTPLAALEKSLDVAKAAPVITRSLRRLSNIRVRNVATLGGHLAHADPHMDLPPVLIALDATVTILGSSGERSLPVESLFLGYLQTALAPDELIAAVEIPPQGARRAVYAKVTTRSAEDWPALGLAVALDLADGSIQSARIAIGAATETTRRLGAAETALTGLKLDAAAITRAAEAAADEADVESDSRGSAPYKRQLIRVHMARALRAAQAEAA